MWRAGSRCSASLTSPKHTQGERRATLSSPLIPLSLQRNIPPTWGHPGALPSSSPEKSLHANHPYILKRQEILGSAASAGSRYTSWGCRRAGVMARWRHRRLMYCTRATSISRLHLRDAFCACLASMQAHLAGDRGRAAHSQSAGHLHLEYNYTWSRITPGV